MDWTLTFLVGDIQSGKIVAFNAVLDGFVTNMQFVFHAIVVLTNIGQCVDGQQGDQESVDHQFHGWTAIFVAGL